jgi:acyl-CoA thioesterase II
VDARTFLGLVRRDDDPLGWRLEVSQGISAGGQFLFGGCGLGAGIEVMEQASGRPCVWASAQYLSYAPVGSIVDLDVTVAVAGHHMTQARCVGRVGAEEIFTVNAALGERPLEIKRVWSEAPDVPSPAASRPRELRPEMVDSVLGRLETRIAEGRQFFELDGKLGSGRSAMWCRLPDLLEPSAAALAVLGDFVPQGIGQALGLAAGGNSLDNTLRVVRVVPSEWILVDVRIQAVDRGFGHGLAHLWAQNGALLATASQSVIVRLWEDGRPAGRKRRGPPPSADGGA